MKRIDTEIKTHPVELLIDFTDLKSHTKLSQDLDDAILTTYVRAAIKTFERASWQVLQDTTFTGFMEGWGDLKIAQFPVRSITSVKYYDSNDDIQTLSADSWQENLKSTPATIRINDTPALFDKPNNIEIEFVAGYEFWYDVPPDIIYDIYFLTAHWYQNRQAGSIQKVFEVPLGFQFITGNNSKKSF